MVSKCYLQYCVIYGSNSSSSIRTSRRFNLISAFLAFLLWGGWAWYVNSDGVSSNSNSVSIGSQTSPLVSSLTQGIGSFVITLVMVRAVAWLYHRMPGVPLRVLWPAVITVAFTGSCLAIAHCCVGTPNIVRTIAPALSVAFAFNVYTAVKLNRQLVSRKANHHE